jgi:alkylhydroperoxidase family enzyme
MPCAPIQEWAVRVSPCGRSARGYGVTTTPFSPKLTGSKRQAESEAMKTKESRFQVHDELTAPELSVPILKGALAGGGQLPNFIGVLAGSPAVLRAYARFRSELRHGSLPYATQQRIALAVAEHQESEYALSTLQRTAREAGLGLDEIALAREFDSRDERESILLRFVKALVESEGSPPRHKQEEALEAGWTDEQILETIAHVALATFGNLVTRAGDVPLDGSSEGSRLLQAA